ncbi:MAG: cytochrome c oxidase subunit 3 [Flavobacteriales bacterium]
MSENVLNPNIMDQNTMSEEFIAKKKSRKPLLFIAMLSMTMMFIGLSSAYIVSKNSSGSTWAEISLPPAFLMATISIVLSSVLVHFAVKKAKSGDFGTTTKLMFGGLILGIVFTVLQFVGFDQLVELGHFAAGSQSTAATSYIYAIVILHLGHMVGALISLIVVCLRLNFKKYSKDNILGIELAEMFWHFLGILWVYLYIFLNTMNAV